MLETILSIILIILKILGILLLSTLLLVVTLLLIVLFVPIRYKSAGNFSKNENGIEHHIFAKITWCLRIISINYQRVDNKDNISFKVFGYDFLNRKRKPKKRKVPVKLSTDTSRINTSISKKEASIIDNNTGINEISSAKKAENSINNNTIKNDNNLKVIENIEEDNTKPNKSIKDRIKEILNKIKEKILSIFNKIKAIADKIKKINNVKNSFIEYLRKDTSKKAIKEIKKIIIKLIKHILPRKLKATVGFGFEDPSTTGKVLGYSSIFYGVYGENLELEPDFDKEVLYGKYMLKGRIRMFNVLLAGFKLYRNKWIREFITFSKETVKDL